MAKLKLKHPEFRHAPSVICGTGSIRALAELDDGTTAFLTSGQEAVNDLVGASLERAGGALTPSNNLCKADGEPTYHSVNEAAKFLRSGAFRRIVAVGGGSVLDWARLGWAESVAALDPDTGALLYDPVAGARPEFWLVPTTCATGAEAADVAVFVPRSGAKTAVVSPAFLADKVVLDGRFLEGMSESRLAASVCDALTHAIEAFLSVVPLQLGKEAALSALNLILSTYGRDLGSIERERLMEAALLGGVAAANCSVGIVHAFAHSVGVDNLPHGLANACALFTGLEYNAQTPQMSTLLQRANLDDYRGLINRVRPVVDHALEGISGHPVTARLRQREYRQQIASRMATDAAIRSNPRRLTEDELLAFVGDVAKRMTAA